MCKILYSKWEDKRFLHAIAAMSYDAEAKVVRLKEDQLCFYYQGTDGK